ncbi:hypothetical protein ACF07T_32880 [Streptomyces sp. NPDC015184]|uniref:hypothetical protein n=1 Tax=Streptomyces sp. NPDC015184 TaxID=3364946 RepID=UPI0036F5B111
MTYYCDDCDTTITAPTDTATVRCPGCGEMADKVTTPADELRAAVEMIRRICPAHLDREAYGRLLAGHFTAHRAAVLREGADALGRMDYDQDSNDYGYDTYRDAWNGVVMDGADLLRRMADEAEQPTPAVAEEPCR